MFRTCGISVSWREMPIRFNYNHRCAIIICYIGNLVLKDEGVIDDFEKAAAHLLLCNLVAKQKSASENDNGDNIAHVLEADASINSSA